MGWGLDANDIVLLGAVDYDDAADLRPFAFLLQDRLEKSFSLSDAAVQVALLCEETRSRLQGTFLLQPLHFPLLSSSLERNTLMSNFVGSRAERLYLSLSLRLDAIETGEEIEDWQPIGSDQLHNKAR